MQNSTFADIYASPMLLVRDGTTAHWKDGKRVPIPKKTVSSYGVVTVSGYDYTDVGFLVEATVRQSKRGGRVTLKIEKSDIASYVEEAPLTTQSVYEIDIDMEPLTPYLLGELSLFKTLDTQDNILNFGRDKGKSVIQLWGQLYRISGPVKEKFNPKDVIKKPLESSGSERTVSNSVIKTSPGSAIRSNELLSKVQKVPAKLRIDFGSWGTGGIPRSIGGRNYFRSNKIQF